MNAMRASVYAGLVILAPLACWLLLEARSTPLPALAPAALNALVLAQAIGIALWIPLLPAASAREQLLASTLLAIVPAPLGALLWLGATISAAPLVRAQLALIAFALAICSLARLVARSPRFAPLLRAALQVTLAALLWQLRPRWLDPLLA